MVRFDTSALPDNATILSASLVFTPASRAASGGLSLVAGWYPAANWPIEAGDWTLSAPSDAHAGTPLATITPNQPVTLTLQNLTSIDRSGLSALRLALSEMVPTGPNDLSIATSEDPNLPPPRLSVTYTVA